MTTPLCYVRPLRRAWGLSQGELTRLLGFRSAPHVSRIEEGKRLPSLQTALSLEVLFGMPPNAMFPALTEECVERVMREAAVLFEAINNDPSLRGARKREFLSNVLKRQTERPDNAIRL